MKVRSVQHSFKYNIDILFGEVNPGYQFVLKNVFLYYSQKHEMTNYLPQGKILMNIYHRESKRKKSLLQLLKSNPDLRACNN